MRILLTMALLLAAGCDETHHSSFYDLGVAFTPIGGACRPDAAQGSECGYPPQFYCTAAGVCASACRTADDCPAGATCVGAGPDVAGECRLASATADGG